MVSELLTLEAYRLSHRLSGVRLARRMQRTPGAKMPVRTLNYYLNPATGAQPTRAVLFKIRKFLRTVPPQEKRRVRREYLQVVGGRRWLRPGKAAA